MTQDKNIQALIDESKGAKKKVRIATEEDEQKFQEKMQEISIKERERATREKAESLGLGYIDLTGFPITPEALSLIPKEKAQGIKAICFLKTSDQLRLGVVDPENQGIIDILSSLEKNEGVNSEVYLISEHSFQTGLKMYDNLPRIRKVVSGIEISQEDLEKFKSTLKSFRDLNEQIKRVSVTEILSMIVAGAIQSRASDIHIEAEEKDVKVRYRIDGVLHDVASLPKEIWPKIINRVKLLSGLKINITKVPQDGRFTIYLTKEFIDVRVSCIPTAYGESVVMRLLMSSAVGLELGDLGIGGEALKQIQHEIDRPNGMILTTGPTGSGKTTTLYAFLKTLNKQENKIITLENPVEYRIAGINQSQVDESRHFGFADGLKSVLRQDPDIVMVGEIRDPETADIAIQAALTGHLMLSTMHTNSAAGAIPRLLSMQVKPYLLAPSLNTIIGQRLVRRVCPNCKKEVKLSDDFLKRVKEDLQKLPKDFGFKYEINNLKFYQGAGCKECSGIGYQGRIGIYEILIMNEEIEKLILTGLVSEYQMQEIAVRHGMVTMVQDGIIKALDGITTIEEVFAVTE